MDGKSTLQYVDVQPQELLDFLDEKDDQNDEQMYVLCEDENEEVEVESDFNEQLAVDGKFFPNFIQIII